MSDEQHPRANRAARFVAPVVFLVAVTIAVLIVRAGLSVDDNTASPPPITLETRAATTAPRPTTQTRPTTQRTDTQPARTTPARELYSIAAGDTLETIAADRGTTVERLLTLNPGLDPIALRIGERIRVE